MNEFAARLLAWYARHGRHDLPWQHERTPYRVWLSEIMLQQTQVQTVIPYFQNFVAALPDLPSLAAAPLDRVLALWSGLGYYSRARNLQRSAEICVERHDGELPRDFAALAALPGIGRSTAGAILAQAFGDRHPVLDGNVKRVLARYHGIRGWPGAIQTQREFWKHADAHTPAQHVADYTQAIMDLGATLCTRSRPQCAACPLTADCIARIGNLTAALPEARPARPLPTRATTLLIVRGADGRVLLERRPPTGVWARLWSLPEADTTGAIEHALRARAGLALRRIGALPGLLHRFTHFRLEATPLLFAVAGDSDRIADDPDLGWFTRADLATLGLPAPVRKLLGELMEETACEPSIA